MPDFNSYMSLLSTLLNAMMNSVRVEQALRKVGSPQKLVNLVGNRVRELSSKTQIAPPLIEQTQGLQQLDIALEEIIQGKITYERIEPDLNPE